MKMSPLLNVFSMSLVLTSTSLSFVSTVPLPLLISFTLINSKISFYETSTKVGTTLLTLHQRVTNFLSPPSSCHIKARLGGWGAPRRRQGLGQGHPPPVGTRKHRFWCHERGGCSLFFQALIYTLSPKVLRRSLNAYTQKVQRQIKKVSYEFELTR